MVGREVESIELKMCREAGFLLGNSAFFVRINSRDDSRMLGFTQIFGT